MTPEVRMWRYVIEQALIDIFHQMNDMRECTENFGALLEGMDLEYKNIMREMKHPWFKRICEEFCGLSHSRIIAAILKYHTDCGLDTVEHLGEKVWQAGIAKKWRRIPIHERKKGLTKYTLIKRRRA